MTRYLIVLGALVSAGLVACSAPGPTRCDELMTADEVRALGRSDTLTKVEDNRGSSICLWEGPAEKGGSFILTLQTADWFDFEQASGPQDSFDRKRKAYDDVIGTDPVPDLGLEARLTRHNPAPTLMVRRRSDVVYLMCTDCSRDQAIAIGRVAAAP
jgi:hypothetical protein